MHSVRIEAIYNYSIYISIHTYNDICILYYIIYKYIIYCILYYILYKILVYYITMLTYLNKTLTILFNIVSHCLTINTYLYILLITINKTFMQHLNTLDLTLLVLLFGTFAYFIGSVCRLIIHSIIKY